MKRLLLMLMIVFACVCMCSAADEHERVNELQKRFGGPYPDLSPESQACARKYVETWSQLFQDLDTGLTLEVAYKKEVLPTIEPLRLGTPSERQIYKAAAAIYRVFEYVRSDGDGGKWTNAECNELLGGEKIDTPQKISQAIANLLGDFLKIASPSRTK